MVGSSIIFLRHSISRLVGLLGLRARLEIFDRRIAREVMDDAREREEREMYVHYEVEHHTGSYL